MDNINKNLKIPPEYVFRNVNDSLKLSFDDNFYYGEYIKQEYIKRYNEDFSKA